MLKNFERAGIVQRPPQGRHQPQLLGSKRPIMPRGPPCPAHAQRSSGSRRCSAFASSHGALIQTSRSSSVVRITGIALGWISSTIAFGEVELPFELPGRDASVEEITLGPFRFAAFDGDDVLFSRNRNLIGIRTV